ncbi:MAG: hypothetical protein ACLUNQ_09700 [Oscillospiraceae bacterium]
MRENYRRFCAAVGVTAESTVFTQQTHSGKHPSCHGAGRRKGPAPPSGLHGGGRPHYRHPRSFPGGLFRRLRHHPAL